MTALLYGCSYHATFFSFDLQTREIVTDDKEQVKERIFMVTQSIPTIESLPDLRGFVFQRLCGDHELLLDAFPTSEAALRRGENEECGRMFTLHGPRSVKLTAIWERDRNRVFFYGPTGKRYLQVLLEE